MSSAYTLSYADEALAVRLMAHEQHAWNELLASVPPMFGDPLADKVSKIVRNRVENDVEYSEMGGMIREMLYVRSQQDNNTNTSVGCDMCEGYGTPGEMYVCDDSSIPCPGCSGGYDEEDGYEMAQKTFLNGLSKERLIELVLMDEEERNDVLYEGARATPIEAE